VIALQNVNEAQHKRQEFISIQKLALIKADEDGFKTGLNVEIVEALRNK